jgi:hypothetical protein
MLDWFFDEIVINVPSKLLRYKFVITTSLIIYKKLFKNHNCLLLKDSMNIVGL